MTARRYAGGESLLQIKRRAQPEADTSGGIQGGYEPEPCEEQRERKAEGRQGNQDTAARMPKGRKGGR